MEKLLGEFSIGLFFWQTVLFLALLFLLRKYAWKPILNAVNEREEGIRNALDSADKAKQDLGWEPKTTLEELCQMMVEADIRRNERGHAL